VAQLTIEETLWKRATESSFKQWHRVVSQTPQREEEQDERTKSLFITFVTFCAVIGVASSLTSRFSLQGLAQTTSVSAKSQKRLGIEIRLAKPMLIPAARSRRVLEAFLRVDNKDVRSDAGPFSAIKVGAAEAADKIEVTVSVLSGDITAVKSCKDWWMLKESSVASYLLDEDEEITVSQLSHLGSNFNSGKLTFKAVPLPQEMLMEGGKCGCARCDSSNLYCCPNPDECMGCGVCGSVCCKIRSE